MYLGAKAAKKTCAAPGPAAPANAPVLLLPTTLTVTSIVCVIDKAALIKDRAQWALVSFSVFYLLWLRKEPRPPGAEPAQITVDSNCFQNDAR